MAREQGKEVLISGASFAGLSCAYWMLELGFEVTVVESGSALKRGGTAVNLRGDTVAIVEKMGLLDAVKAERLNLRRLEFKNAQGATERKLVLQHEGEAPSDAEFEIERNVLLDLLYAKIHQRCNLVFEDSISGIAEEDHSVLVSFRKGHSRSFDLVLGCDGMRSNVRKLWFGDEARYSHFLQQYFSITIVEKLLIERDTAQMFNEPGKAIMLNAYKNKTDIVLGFVSETEIPYDYRDEVQQRQIIAEQFRAVGWRSTELLTEIERSSDFYFDKLSQIRMPEWSRGRVALVGDAAYCPSPAAGLGGSLALDGAAALAESLRAAKGDHVKAFADYEIRFRPFVEEVQAQAVKNGLETLVPRTAEAIRARNAGTHDSF